jgi:uncharacterized protein (DUF58 family)
MRSRANRPTLRSRLRSWALKRQGRDVPPLRLRGRRIYIVPTPAGWTFALLLGVMFIAGMNYGNGLALLFTFWLAGFALVAMVQTQRGLAGMQLHGVEVLPVHAGEHLTLQLRVSGRNAPQDLKLQLDDVIAAPVTHAGSGPDARADESSVAVDIPTTRRGRWHAPPLHISSVAPFGLFRTWTWLQLEASTIVYPRAQGSRSVPESAGENPGSIHQPHGHDELAWLRDFREGDSPRQVAWKAYARGAPLLVREYHGEGAVRRDFDFDALVGLDTEARLSQLARWIVDAHARGESWVLRLPGAAPLAGNGSEHRAECLARLALYGTAGRTP